MGREWPRAPAGRANALRARPSWGVAGPAGRGRRAGGGGRRAHGREDLDEDAAWEHAEERAGLSGVAADDEDGAGAEDGDAVAGGAGEGSARRAAAGAHDEEVAGVGAGGVGEAGGEAALYAQRHALKAAATAAGLVAAENAVAGVAIRDGARAGTGAENGIGGPDVDQNDSVCGYEDVGRSPGPGTLGAFAAVYSEGYAARCSQDRWRIFFIELGGLPIKVVAH